MAEKIESHNAESGLTCAGSTIQNDTFWRLNAHLFIVLWVSQWQFDGLLQEHQYEYLCETQ